MQSETRFHPTGEPTTVFVIEREQVVRSALDFILRDRYRTCAFASLDEALAAVTDAPDIVLLGSSFLQGQRDLLPAVLATRFSSAAILVIADSDGAAAARHALERGAHGIIGKPISFDTVCDAVERALAGGIPRGKASRLARTSLG
ncbi:response regulator transcription factor [Bradyrhizobium iriomotense]|uniref:response regulator transcription factor n=1 Tax=Bradyrhizobium iriomotense TaxID=441950 RepID=UPI001B89EEA0|nr:response regulator transcription factor [Bradyrhizobium iriomotense]MBR1131773.1 response regulator transcription factor [Bradyrhizobium iriomotense]